VTSLAPEQILLLVLGVLTAGFPWLADRTGMPLLQVLGRWVRWAFFAAAFAFLIEALGISYRPYWVHFITGFALWFLLETGYNWLAIKALSRSDLPLFPTFRANRDGDEWPADAHAIEVKDWLRAKEFKRLGALKAQLFEDAYLRASVYESPDRQIRVQVLFIPKRKGESVACYTVTTHGEDGRRLITDNHFLPYGGYYPENWDLARKPLIGSLPRLVRLHQKRMLQTDIQPVPAEDDPIEELNEQQRILERLNVETGFLFPRAHREEEGKITAEGRYRLWKEMWLLAYFGKSVV